MHNDSGIYSLKGAEQIAVGSQVWESFSFLGDLNELYQFLYYS